MCYSPINPYDNVDDPSMKDLDDDQRIIVSIIHGVIYFIAIAVAIIICSMFHSCTTPQIVEQHHHYHEADTMAVQAQVDRNLTSWHAEMIQYFDERLDQYSASLVSHENEKEIISELITVTSDSLGRTIRQEQRTISRDITRELQQQEQRITQEYERRLHTIVDSLDDTYRQRYDSLAAHVIQMDSTFVKKTPAGDTRPWYKRWWSSVQYILIGAILIIAVYLTRHWWIRLLKK